MDKTTELLCEVLTMLCDIRKGYRDRDLHKPFYTMVAEAREHLAKKGIDGDGAWTFGHDEDEDEDEVSS